MLKDEILTSSAAVLLIALVATVHPATSRAEDAAQIHNMILVGEERVFLSNIPKFGGLNEAKTQFTSPDRYQVIVEVNLSQSVPTAREIYLNDRRRHVESNIYTFSTQPLGLSRFVSQQRDSSNQLEMAGKVLRGKLGQGGQVVTGLENVQVGVTRVVYGRMFDPHTTKPEQLTYVVVGKAQESSHEFFLAHTIFAPPDFDQIVVAELKGYSDADLKKNPRLVFSLENVAAKRLTATQTAPAKLMLDGATAKDVLVMVRKELYFDKGGLD